MATSKRTITTKAPATPADRQAARDAAAEATSKAPAKATARTAAKVATDAKAAAATAADKAKAPAAPMPDGWPGRVDAAGSFVRYARVLRRNGHAVAGYDTAAATTDEHAAMVDAWRKAGLAGRYVVVDLSAPGTAASSDAWATVYAASCAWGDAPLAASVGTADERRARGVLPPKAAKAVEAVEAAPVEAVEAVEATKAPAKRTRKAKAEATAS